MNRILKCFVLLLVVAAVGCAPSRIVRPLKKGEDRWGLSLGGPLIKYAGGVLPVPITTLSYAKAISDSLTWFTALHTTSTLFNNFQGEIGFCYNLYQNNKFRLFKDSVNLGVSINPVANFGMHMNGVRNILTGKYTVNNPNSTLFSGVKLWPQLDVNAHISYGRKDENFFYIGLSNWFDVNQPYGYDTKKKPAFFYVSPQVGNTWNDKKGLWSFTVEAKYLAPYINNQNKVVDYVRPGKTGAIGFFIGITKKIVRPQYDDD